jgi:protoporphyrinogen oxidase
MKASGRKKTAIIIGAGPAGLTAAYELLTRTDIHPIVLEKDPVYVGGIARTIQYKGNRMDIGGHRFFSKSDRVTEWWLSMLPLESGASGQPIAYRGKAGVVPKVTVTGSGDKVMLLRPRLSRMHYTKQFFDYPVTLSYDTLRKLGVAKITKIGITYFFRKFFPRKPERSLEDFYINRFGDELYKTFFRSYTEKLWGMECSKISPEWGAQRVKGLSITVVLLNAISKLLPSLHAKKKVETSLIEQFLYPKFGPGHLWETVRDEVVSRGGEVHMGYTVLSFEQEGNRVVAVSASGPEGVRRYEADYVFSTMPVSELVQGMEAPEDITSIARDLPYRDFITVGVQAKKLALGDGTVPDTWIYIHEPSVKMCRIQFFNNWSPYLIKDPSKQWFGLEYVISTKDALWQMSDEEVKRHARDELKRLELVRDEDIEDMTVVRMEKTYPAYFGTYESFDQVRDFLNTIENLYPIGRNGMHRYNNQDHSMLVAMVAVDNILEERVDKQNLWEVNAEQEYHEEKK